jgi:hypothetical protein
MKDRQIVRTLLLETHHCIETAAKETAAKIGRKRKGKRSRKPHPVLGDFDLEALLYYPPVTILTPGEEKALRSMKLSRVERSAMRKLVADGCASAFFRFFNLLDATGNPEVKPPRGTWLGGCIVASKDSPYREMLHDTFYESYHEYSKLHGK